MPYKPKKPCARSRCSNLTHGKYCEEQKGLHKVSIRYNRKKDTRPTSTKRGYDYSWRKIRGIVLKDKPLCWFCGRVYATEVHQVPDYVSGTCHWNYQLIPACKKCHNRETAKRKKGNRRLYI